MFLIFSIIISNLIILIDASCPSMNHYENDRIQQKTIGDFSEFSQLNFANCSNTFIMSSIRLKPTEKIILDNSLNFAGLKIKSTAVLFNIVFSNIKGIDFRLNCLESISFEKKYEPKSFFWYFDLTNFDFYINNQLITQDKCNLDLFQQSASFLSRISFLILNTAVTYSTQTCPLLFHNVQIQVLIIDNLKESLIDKNILSFQNKSIEYIDTNILQLILNVFRYNLDERLLNEFIFKNLVYLDINGILNSIQSDLFKHLKQLKLLRFRTQNAKSLLTKKNKWLNYLNVDTINLNQLDSNDYQDKMLFLTIFQVYSNVTFYDYPEQDFCYFKDFPHQRLVLPHLKPTYKSSCSCTELFLIQNSYKYKYEDNEFLLTNYYNLENYYYNEIIDQRLSICINSSIDQLLLKCNFNEKLKLCNVKSLIAAAAKSEESSNQFEWYVNDWEELSKYLYNIFTFYVNPILSIICILVNILIVLIFSSRSLKKDIQFLYKYLNIHLIANIIFISIHYLDLINECTYEEIFCSKLNNSIYANFFKTYILKMIKNTLSTFSNIAYTSFVLIRYIKITNTKNLMLLKFKDISLKIYLLITICFSILINIYVCFEYTLQYKELNDVSNTVRFDYFKINLSQNENILYNIFQYVKIIFSDLLFFLAALLFDIFLIVFINRKNENNTINLVVGAVNNQRLERKQTAKKRIIGNIVMNGINFLILRLPLSIIDIYGLIVSINISNKIIQYKPNLSIFIVCRLFRFCNDIQLICFTFYLVSFLIQFFLFFKLDNNFLLSLKSFKFFKNRN
jgi:hypothetical protein